MHTIYKIKHRTSGKFYIGRSSNVNARWTAHRSMLRRNVHFVPEMQKDFNNDPHCFEYSILEEYESYDDALNAEQRWIDKYYGTDVMYNQSPNAITGVVLGEKHSCYGKHPKDWIKPENYDHYLKHSVVGIDKSGKNNGFYGHHHSEKTKALYRDGRCSNFGKDNGFYGKKHTDETKAKISKSRKGKTAGAKNPAAQHIIVDGIEYSTVGEASLALGYKNKTSIYSWMKRPENKDRFKYVN